MRACFIFIFLFLLIFLGCAKPSIAPPEIVVDVSQLAPEAAQAMKAQFADALSKPQDGASWQALGMLYQAHGLLEAAVQAYEYARSRTSDQRSLYLLSVAYARLGLYERALDRASQVDNYTPAVWKRGFWLLDLGRFEEAAELFQQVIDQDSAEVAAYVGMVRVRIAQERPDEAIVLIESLQSRGADHPYLTFLLGTAHQRAGHAEIATPLLQVPVVGPPSWNDPWLTQMRALKRGFASSISKALDKVDGGDLQGALADLEAIAINHPRNPAVLNNLATVYLLLGNTTKSLQILTKSIRWNPTYAPTHFTMARAFMQMGDLDRAASYAHAAIEHQPAMSVAYALSGRIATAQRKLEDARTYLSQAIAIGNNEPATRELLAMVLLDLNETVDAMHQFTLVLQVMPQSTTSIGGLAIAKAQLGDIDGARIDITQAKRKFPNDPRIESALQTINQMRGRP